MDKIIHDYYSDPSNSCQWQEKQTSRQSWDAKYAFFKPKIWTKSDIDNFKDVLAKSYDCSSSLITHSFSCIDNENDDQKDYCVNLVYYLKCERENVIVDRQIYSIKVLIPDEIRQRISKIIPKTEQNIIPNIQMPIPIKPIKKN